MTLGNQRRIRETMARLKMLANINPVAQEAALSLLTVQEALTTVLIDLVLRPEANDK